MRKKAKSARNFLIVLSVCVGEEELVGGNYVERQ